MDINRCWCFRLPQLIVFSGWRLQNFEIRVGQDAVDLGRNAICYKQVPAVPDGATVNTICTQELFGSWVSVNKSATQAQSEHLQLREVRVFGYRGKWYAMSKHIENFPDVKYMGQHFTVNMFHGKVLMVKLRVHKGFKVGAKLLPELTMTLSFDAIRQYRFQTVQYVWTIEHGLCKLLLSKWKFLTPVTMSVKTIWECFIVGIFYIKMVKMQS